MACSKYTLTNTGSTVVNFSYRRCEDSLWEYQVELNPSQSKNIWLIDNTYSDISKNAFIKKRNDISIEHFESINNNLINFIYNDTDLKNKKGRNIAIDCSNLCFLNKLNSDFKPNKYNT